MNFARSLNQSTPDSNAQNEHLLRQGEYFNNGYGNISVIPEDQDERYGQANEQVPSLGIKFKSMKRKGKTGDRIKR